MSKPVLEAIGLKKFFPVHRGALHRPVGFVRAVDDVSFTIGQGETLGLAGESGSGKTTTAKMILMLEQLTAGSLRFQGRELGELRGATLKEYRSNVQAVLQDPWSSMDPRMRARTIVAEPLVVNTKLSRREREQRVLSLLEHVGLRPDQASHYPHEFSGGQRQRIAVARALALHPSLIVLDEPVSALDVSIRAQIMNLLKDLQEEHRLSYLLIAHNLATVRYMSHHVAIMYLGGIVEHAVSDELFTNPLHPYTKALISASMPTDIGGASEIIIQGEIPSPLNPPSGCRFHPRCAEAMEICSQVRPSMKRLSPSHSVSCHLHNGQDVLQPEMAS